jgi:ketosteroid isomerase-like protein
MSPIYLDRAESGVRTVIAFTAAFNRHDLSGMLQLVSQDCVFEASSPPPAGAIYKGKVAITHYWQNYFERTLNPHLKIDETIGFGLRCIALWRCEWAGASGVVFHLRGIDLFCIQNGPIIEQLSYIKG